MKALLPHFCRPMGYALLALALIIPFMMYFAGLVHNANLLFIKETAKLLMTFGALMILLALRRDESQQTEQIRVWAVRAAVFVTVMFQFGRMLMHVARHDFTFVDSSSFLIFLILNVLCLEFGLQKAAIENRMKNRN